MRRFWPTSPSAFFALSSVIALAALSTFMMAAYLSPPTVDLKIRLLSRFLGLMATGSLLFFTAGAIIWWQSRHTASDDSIEHKQMREKLADTTSLLKAIISETPGLVYAKDLEGRIILANPAAQAMMGKPWSELEGRTAAEYLPDAAKALDLMANDRQIMDSQIAETMEITAPAPPGAPRIWLATKAPLRDDGGNVIGLVVISVDITERKAAAARFDRLAKKIAHMGRVHAMGELSLTLAHELNQPLATIINHIGIAEHAIAREASIDHTDVAKRLRAATDQAMRAGHIVKRLRTFVETIQPEKQPENVSDLVSEAVDLISGALSEPGPTIALALEDRTAEVLADRLQIQNVVINLLLNASEAVEKLAISNSEISVTVRSTPRATVEIIVDDNGPGISEEQRVALFDKFSTTHSRESGLGIPISLRILADHGGDLVYDDGGRGGARLIATLPLLKKS